MRVIGLARLVVMVFAIACGEPESTATSTTAAPTSKPTEPPPSTPTPTQMEDLIVKIEGQIDEKVQEQGSSCYVNENIDVTISTFSSRSVNYLRGYLSTPELSTSDIRHVIDYLEGQRGNHERLCNQERGRIVPDVKNVSEIVKHYDMFDEGLREDKPCVAAERAQALSGHVPSSGVRVRHPVELV